MSAPIDEATKRALALMTLASPRPGECGLEHLVGAIVLLASAHGDGAGTLHGETDTVLATAIEMLQAARLIVESKRHGHAMALRPTGAPS